MNLDGAGDTNCAVVNSVNDERPLHTVNSIPVWHWTALGLVGGPQHRPHIPVFDKSGRNDGTWTRIRHGHSDRWHDMAHLRVGCRACPSKPKCCPNADPRKITCGEHEDARQVARDIAKTHQYDISMKLRKKVKILFAHLKRILGLGRL